MRRTFNISAPQEEMDELRSISPEIEVFVSRENRQRRDPCLQHVDWLGDERTIVLHINTTPGNVSFEIDDHKMLETLACSTTISIYFPASLDEKPFCFCADDSLVPAVEAANGRLRPLSCNSVLAVVTTVLRSVKQEATTLTSRLAPRGDGRSTRVAMAAEAVMAAIKSDPLGADLALALFSMAASSYRRDTVCSPFPKQLEATDGQRAYATLVSALNEVPAMDEASTWTGSKRLLQLPPVALVSLHFVLVFLPTTLRALDSRRTGSFDDFLQRGRQTVGRIEQPAANLGTEEGTTRGTEPPARGRDAASTRLGAPAASRALGDVPSYAFDVTLPSDPAFEAEAHSAGSTIAYHGSSAENFHSIVNNGLRVMSGSRLMKHGAAFGEGIYLSGSRAAAASFAQRGDGVGTTVWPRSAFARGHGGADDHCRAQASRAKAQFRYRIVAKCRLLKGNGVTEIEGGHKQESYFVVSDETRVRVEELYLFHVGQDVQTVPKAGGTAFTRDAPPYDSTASTGDGMPAAAPARRREALRHEGSEAEETFMSSAELNEDMLKKLSLRVAGSRSALLWLLAAACVVVCLTATFGLHAS